MEDDNGWWEQVYDPGLALASEKLNELYNVPGFLTELAAQNAIAASGNFKDGNGEVDPSGMNALDACAACKARILAGRTLTTPASDLIGGSLIQLQSAYRTTPIEYIVTGSDFPAEYSQKEVVTTIVSYSMYLRKMLLMQKYYGNVYKNTKFFSNATANWWVPGASSSPSTGPGVITKVSPRSELFVSQLGISPGWYPTPVDPNTYEDLETVAASNNLLDKNIYTYRSQIRYVAANVRIVQVGLVKQVLNGTKLELQIPFTNLANADAVCAAQPETASLAVGNQDLVAVVACMERASPDGFQIWVGGSQVNSADQTELLLDSFMQPGHTVGSNEEYVIPGITTNTTGFIPQPDQTECAVGGGTIENGYAPVATSASGKCYKVYSATYNNGANTMALLVHSAQGTGKNALYTFRGVDVTFETASYLNFAPIPTILPNLNTQQVSVILASDLENGLNDFQITLDLKPADTATDKNDNFDIRQAEKVIRNSMYSIFPNEPKLEEPQDCQRILMENLASLSITPTSGGQTAEAAGRYIGYSVIPAGKLPVRQALQYFAVDSSTGQSPTNYATLSNQELYNLLNDRDRTLFTLNTATNTTSYSSQGLATIQIQDTVLYNYRSVADRDKFCTNPTPLPTPNATAPNSFSGNSYDPISTENQIPESWCSKDRCLWWPKTMTTSWNFLSTTYQPTEGKAVIQLVIRANSLTKLALRVGMRDFLITRDVPEWRTANVNLFTSNMFTFAGIETQKGSFPIESATTNVQFLGLANRNPASQARNVQNKNGAIESFPAANNINLQADKGFGHYAILNPLGNGDSQQIRNSGADETSNLKAINTALKETVRNQALSFFTIPIMAQELVKTNGLLNKNPTDQAIDANYYLKRFQQVDHQALFPDVNNGVVEYLGYPCCVMDGELTLDILDVSAGFSSSTDAYPAGGYPQAWLSLPLFTPLPTTKVTLLNGDILLVSQTQGSVRDIVNLANPGPSHVNGTQGPGSFGRIIQSPAELKATADLLISQNPDPKSPNRVMYLTFQRGQRTFLFGNNFLKDRVNSATGGLYPIQDATEDLKYRIYTSLQVPAKYRTYSTNPNLNGMIPAPQSPAFDGINLDLYIEDLLNAAVSPQFAPTPSYYPQEVKERAAVGTNANLGTAVQVTVVGQAPVFVNGVKPHTNVVGEEIRELGTQYEVNALSPFNCLWFLDYLLSSILMITRCYSLLFYCK